LTLKKIQRRRNPARLESFRINTRRNTLRTAKQGIFRRQPHFLIQGKAYAPTIS
jgi:predicted pyridoxine 5'-phosphate oxidase superfamily flavin-nucleotide-binding protein